MSNSLYKKLLVKSEFSWQCPSCLFTVLLNNEVIDSIDLSSSADESINELSAYHLPSTLDVLKGSFHGVRVVHHNAQGLHSKMTEIIYSMVGVLCQ